MCTGAGRLLDGTVKWRMPTWVRRFNNPQYLGSFGTLGGSPNGSFSSDVIRELYATMSFFFSRPNLHFLALSTAKDSMKKRLVAVVVVETKCSVSG